MVGSAEPLRIWHSRGLKARENASTTCQRKLRRNGKNTICILNALSEAIRTLPPGLSGFSNASGERLEELRKRLRAFCEKPKSGERINQAPVNDRQRKVINRLLDGFEGKLSTAKYAKLAKCSTDTALRDIKNLLERGVLIQGEGGGRNTSYHFAELEETPHPP